MMTWLFAVAGTVTMAQAVAPLSLPVSPWEPYALALGGVLGAACRAFFKTGQANWSRETVQDVVLGGVIGFLWSVPMSFPVVGDVWPPFELPKASLAQRAVIVGVFCWLTVEMVKTILMRWAPTWFEKYTGKVNGASQGAGS